MRTDIFLDAFGGTRKRTRTCTRCGSRNSNADAYDWCKVCRELGAMRTRAYRRDHIGRKLCPHCIEKKGRATKTCEYHRKYVNAWMDNMRSEQRAAGLCAWGRCPEATDDTWFCQTHREMQYAARDHRERRYSRAA